MFAVIWRDFALDAMADEYVVADLPRRAAIEAAVSRMNVQLATDPYGIGESRTGKRRIAFEPPCAITYLVDEPAGIVRVTHFWTY